MSELPAYPSGYRQLAAALGQLGRTSEAEAALKKSQALSTEASEPRRPPFMSPADHAHLVDGLRKAGWKA